MLEVGEGHTESTLETREGMGERDAGAMLNRFSTDTE